MRNLLVNVHFKKDFLLKRIISVYIFMLCFCVATLANLPNSTYSADQTRVVTGQVLSTNGISLPGVTVAVKGTSQGTVTDLNGNYSIGNLTDQTTLVFSFIGMKTQEIVVGNQTNINVTMVEETIGIEEVVAVGYGTQRRSDLSGSVVSVKSDDFRNQSASNINQLIQGRVSGVDVTTQEGKPGANSGIIIRGAGSINGVSPLYIIDGIRGSGDNRLNAKDIESIEILKDAAAAAIYGAQAAHGVILITTKQGKQGKPVVNFSTKWGKSEAVGLPEMLGTEDYINVRRQTMLNDDPNVVIDPSFVATNPAWPNTDWKSALYGGSGLQQEYDLSVSAGAEKLTYFISTNYKKDDGINVDNSFERFGLRINSEVKVSDRIKIGEFLSVTRRELNPTAGEDHDLRKIFRAVPTMNIYDDTNPVYGWGRSPIYFSGTNPLGEELQNKSLNNTLSVDGSLYTEVEPVNNFKIRATFGYGSSNFDSWGFSEPYDYGSLTGPIARLSRGFSVTEQLTGTVTARYDNSFGNHNIDILGGYEAYRLDSRAMSGSKQEFPNITDVESFSLSTSGNAVVGGNVGEFRLLSQFARLNYSYAGKYLLQANVRRDGNSRFGPTNKYGIFPSVSAGWNMHLEDFMQSNNLISNLKLRASYGKLGSDAGIPGYSYMSTLTSQRIFYHYNQAGTDSRGGFGLFNMPNADIHWESMVITNLGVDFGLFSNKLTGTLEYYVKNTDDMIYNVNIPYATGIGVITNAPQPIPTNIGQMSNKGWDFNVLFRDEIGGFKYSIGGNASFNENEITKLFDAKSVLNDGNEVYMSGSITRTELGMPMGYFYGFIVDGIFKDQAEVDAFNDKNPNGFYQVAATRPGDFKYKDIASLDAQGNRVLIPDGRITDADKTEIGNPWPKMIYGINLDAEYKGFDMSIDFQGANGVDLYHAAKFAKRIMKADYNTTRDVFEAWTPENQTNHPRLTNNDPNGNMSRHSSYFVEDGSYLKLRNLVVGYTLPGNISNLAKLERARVYFSAQNVLTLTKYTGMDPELGGGVRTRGIEGLERHPQVSILAFGLEVTF